jgi:hypothetical protein
LLVGPRSVDGHEGIGQAIADGLIVSQAAHRFSVSVDEVCDAQKQALKAFSGWAAIDYE